MNNNENNSHYAARRDCNLGLHSAAKPNADGQKLRINAMTRYCIITVFPIESNSNHHIYIGPPYARWVNRKRADSRSSAAGVRRRGITAA